MCVETAVMAENQIRILQEKGYQCYQLMLKRREEDQASGGRNYSGWCEVVFDNILCWDRARPGTSVHQPCPEYIHKFKTDEFAVRTCTADGTWEIGPNNNNSWTNYTACVEKLKDISYHMEHGDRLKTMYTVGYSVSLAALVIAVFIMLCCRRLQSKSNTLHINLFLAFILRAVLASLKDHLFVDGLGLPKDVTLKNIDGRMVKEFIQDGVHWECRLITVLFFFAISATQTWILMEGLYLYMLIHQTIITERYGVKPYILLGWALPWVFMIPWIIVKKLFENTFCWTMQENQGYFWILQGPWIAIVVINFFFFLDIFRVLFMRVRSNHRHAGNSKYRKFAKFILVLIPLFGIMYIVLNIAFPAGQTDAQEFNVIYLYIEMGYNSFQGFILALLFCFLNEDVHSELRRLWIRHRSRRENSNYLRRSLAGSTWRQVSRDASSSDKTHQSRHGYRSCSGKRRLGNGSSVRGSGNSDHDVNYSSPGILSSRGEKRPLCGHVSTSSLPSTGNSLQRVPSDGSNSSFLRSTSHKAKRPSDWGRKKKGGTVLLGREADNGFGHHSNGGVPAKIIMLDSDSGEETTPYGSSGGQPLTEQSSNVGLANVGIHSDTKD